MPLPMVRALRRRMGFLSLVSPKRRSPAPSTTGKIFSRSSSTRSCSISVRTSWKLAGTTISPLSSCFSFETASTASPLSTVELFQSGSSRVEDTTYLGRLFKPVRQLATPGWPPRGEPLVAPPTQQQGLGAQGLVERELVEFWAVLDQADPAADPEALVTGRVLDDSVERDVLADHDLSHFDSPFLCPVGLVDR